ncbi:hypothetical protein [Polymorphospora sp. NPDC050346]|uniref:hypothetical protein n=1 Tax=Polymorphospora sp. NPDC050346 TaxID=3155780 RepID=UPI0033E9FEC8
MGDPGTPETTPDGIPIVIDAEGSEILYCLPTEFVPIVSDEAPGPVRAGKSNIVSLLLAGIELRQAEVYDDPRQKALREGNTVIVDECPAVATYLRSATDDPQAPPVQ